ncbi:DUF305 domain-containing protein [Streptomyces andamanensis]|uniref:DUF305 domain-containing protein n=1 Tax=Streptomyces andamanensis TaxID=1565035 RepID=A0ABV8TGK9_9ACTN
MTSMAIRRTGRRVPRTGRTFPALPAFPTLRTFRLRHAALPGAVLAAALALTACGGGSGGTSSAGHSAHGNGSTGRPSATAPAGPGKHNAQDVTFAQEMIPHHRQAVEMAALAPSRARSPQVKDLAAQIRQAQDPEIETMTGWLKAWGAGVPSAGPSGMPGMPGMDHSASGSASGHPGSGHSASPMPGMMTDTDMDELAGLSGDAFDRAFLRMMIGHHEGAVAMARTEQAEGADRAAVALAKSVTTSQSAEIDRMRKLLGGR